MLTDYRHLLCDPTHLKKIIDSHSEIAALDVERLEAAFHATAPFAQRLDYGLRVSGIKFAAILVAGAIKRMDDARLTSIEALQGLLPDAVAMAMAVISERRTICQRRVRELLDDPVNRRQYELALREQVYAKACLPKIAKLMHASLGLFTSLKAPSA